MPPAKVLNNSRLPSSGYWKFWKYDTRWLCQHLMVILEFKLWERGEGESSRDQHVIFPGAQKRVNSSRKCWNCLLMSWKNPNEVSMLIFQTRFKNLFRRECEINASRYTQKGNFPHTNNFPLPTYDNWVFPGSFLWRVFPIQDLFARFHINERATMEENF